MQDSTRLHKNDQMKRLHVPPVVSVDISVHTLPSALSPEIHLILIDNDPIIRSYNF